MAPILEMRGITKTFPGVKALDNVNLVVEQGEIHAICGENGAGKSTLMKVLSGVLPARHLRGRHRLRRRGPVLPRHPRFRTCRHHHHPPGAGARAAPVDRREHLPRQRDFQGRHHQLGRAFRRSSDLLKQVGLSEPPTTLIKDMGVGKQQLVEIAKALSKKVRLLILDEPTASLNERDSQALLDLLLEFKKQGLTSIMISHKLNEISRVADSITVIRDGSTVSTLDCKAGVSEDQIIRDMVGRQLDDRYPPRQSEDRRGLVRGEGLERVPPPQHAAPDREGRLLQRCKGEIVGIAGLMGAGRTELAMRSSASPTGATSRARRSCTASRWTCRRSRRPSRRGSPTSRGPQALRLLLEDDIRPEHLARQLPASPRAA